ncbi:MAG: alpha/beta hydrolase [Verrucomicrobiota bacterium]
MEESLPSDRFFDSKAASARIRIRSWPAGPDLTGNRYVLLLHGLGDHVERHHWAAQLLTKGGIDVIGIDWPGNGKSSGRPGVVPPVETCCELIDEAIAEIGHPPVGIFAHSTGGFLVLSWLKRRSLATDEILPDWIWLSSPLLRPRHRQSPLKLWSARHLAKWFPKFTIGTGVSVDDCFATLALPEETGAWRQNCHHRISLEFGASLLAEEPHIWDDVEVWAQSVEWLITQGADDPVCPARYASDWYSQLHSEKKTLLWIADSRHEPYRDIRSIGVFSAIRAWIGSRFRLT